MSPAAGARRILFFADASSVHTQRWVQAMAERGFEALVATRLPAAVPGAAEVVALHPGRDGAGWFRALPAARRLVRQWRPRWVHGHYVTSYGLWAAAAPGPAPRVLTAWGSDILVTPRAPGVRGRAMAALVRWNLRRAELITADAADVLAAIRGHGARCPCHEVLWGADTELFAPAPRRDAGSGGYRLISLRNWEPNYNIDVLLRAFALLRRERPALNAQLELLGGGPLEAELKALAAQLGVADAVQFTGRVAAAQMAVALQRAQLCVSVPSSDATSVALLEALACAVPVVVTDLPANRAWVPAAAQRVPARDADALARALLHIAGLPDQGRALGAAGRRQVLQRASRRAQMDRMAALYESLPWRR